MAPLTRCLPEEHVNKSDLIFATDETCHLAQIFAGESATGYGALPLSYAHRFAAMSGGIRTRDLPINSRSNPCLHHRQSGFLFCRDLACYVSVKQIRQGRLARRAVCNKRQKNCGRNLSPGGLEQSDNKEAVNAGNKVPTGNNRPGCSGPSF